MLISNIHKEITKFNHRETNNEQKSLTLLIKDIQMVNTAIKS